MIILNKILLFFISHNKKIIIFSLVIIYLVLTKLQTRPIIIKVVCTTLRSTHMQYVNRKGDVHMIENKENEELKPRSFRISDEVMAKFRDLTAEIGGNQQETLSQLIAAYEFQSSKVILTEKKRDIETFEKYANCLIRMFMSSLEDNQNLTQTIRSEFDALLKSKDSTIQDLQGKLATTEQQKKEATTKAKVHVDENTRLNSYIDTLKKDYDTRLTDMESMLQDKESLNKALTDSCNSLKGRMESLEATAATAKELQQELDKLKEVEKEKAELEKKLEQEQAEYEKQLENQRKELTLEKDNEVLEVKRKYQEQINKLKEDKTKEIDKYQKKYFELLEQMKKQQTIAEEKEKKVKEK